MSDASRLTPRVKPTCDGNPFPICVDLRLSTRFNCVIQVHTRRPITQQAPR